MKYSCQVLSLRNLKIISIMDIENEYKSKKNGFGQAAKISSVNIPIPSVSKRGDKMSLTWLREHNYNFFICVLIHNNLYNLNHKVIVGLSFMEVDNYRSK